MKTFSAALLAASVSAATTYTATGTTTTGVASSKVTAEVSLDGTKLTTKHTMEVVLSAALESGQDVHGVLCTLREASVSVCSVCKANYSSGTQYLSSFIAGGYTTTAPTLVNASDALYVASNFA